MNNFEEYLTANNINCVLIDNNIGHIGNKRINSMINYKNPYYHILDIDSNMEYILMECNKDIYTKISVSNIDYIKSLKTSWFICKNGYIATNHECKQLYLHQFITNHYGNGRGNLSVDHINRDKLDNRLENLRITNQSEQNKNCDKRTRKYNAIDLPDELKHSTLPKYIYYCSETMNKGKSNEYIRDYFRIEKHPKLNKKCWSSPKSVKMSIIDKLILTKKYLEQLDSNAVIDLSEQTKRKRNSNAKQLPRDIIQSDMPKYVNYCSETMNKGKPNEYIRDFFRIEKHPKLNKKCWSSSKSVKLSITEKLNLTKKYLNEFEN